MAYRKVTTKGTLPKKNPRYTVGEERETIKAKNNFDELYDIYNHRPILFRPLHDNTKDDTGDLDTKTKFGFDNIDVTDDDFTLETGKLGPDKSKRLATTQLPFDTKELEKVKSIENIYSAFMKMDAYEMNKRKEKNEGRNKIQNKKKSLWFENLKQIEGEIDPKKFDITDLKMPVINQKYQEKVMKNLEKPQGIFVKKNSFTPFRQISDLIKQQQTSQIPLSGKSLIDAVFDHPGSFGIGFGIEEIEPVLKFAQIKHAAPVTIELLKKFYILSKLIDYDPNTIDGQIHLSTQMTRLPMTEHITWTLLRTFPRFNKLLTKSRHKIYDLHHSPVYVRALVNGDKWIMTESDYFWYSYIYSTLDHNCIHDPNTYKKAVGNVFDLDGIYGYHLSRLLSLFILSSSVRITGPVWRFLMFEKYSGEDYYTNDVLKWMVDNYPSIE